MHKNAVSHLTNNALDWILAALLSLSLTSCSMNTAVNTKPWGQNPKEAPNVLSGSFNAIWSVVFSPDSRIMASGGADIAISLWDAKTGKRLRTLTTSAEHPNQIYRRRPEQASLGPLNPAARGMPVTALLVAGQVIEYLCKICCLAERKPFPYAKWLVEVAKKTYLGVKVYPFMEKAVLGIEEFVNPPMEKHFRELIPLKELRLTEQIIQSGLKELGWHCDWIDNIDEAVAEAMKRPAL